MDVSAIVMMIIGMSVIWGGLALSLRHAAKVSKQKKANR
ncbi:methionine/alanine import family NSS transporter small subunit [Texcoconibacillus texcoconensis]|uniref:Methionine/alanine importer small subunit n=1 Tax=Texcoconibacillus texcoconensis TaxID=1095777 RepID=A0A840QQ81_9BACI|nr:methionine/alanine import family NSS transporter small subunit [Texcoconibacillus texcoconensis]MBB5173534.1 hypothetical protein [Texcoconibacillus texcoconensis]